MFAITLSEYDYQEDKLFNDLLYVRNTKEEARAKLEEVHSDILKECAEHQWEPMEDSFEPGCDEFSVQIADSLLNTVTIHEIPSSRNIILYDGEELIVETNAPENEIYGAIEYKDQRLDDGADEPGGDWKGDFEEMQDYLNEKGYTFKEVGYINHELSTPNKELERYDW